MTNDTRQPKMKGGIRKRGDSYTIAISLGRNPVTGKYKYHYETVTGTREQAKKRRAELINQLDNGTFIKPSKLTIAEYLRRWLTDYARPNLSPKAFERYENIVQAYLTPTFGTIILTQLRPEHIQGYYTSMMSRGLSPSTVKYHHAVIHKALRTAMKWQLLKHNPADGVDVPRQRHVEMQTWDDSEVRQFLEVAKRSSYYVLFHTALFTGMRRSELLGLQWRDIDIQQIHVSRSLHRLRDGRYVFTQPKSAKSRRAIDLSPSSVLTLAEHKERQEGIRTMLGIPLTQDDLVFSTPEGNPLRPDTVTRAWRMLAVKAGVKPIRLHDARHTHATLMLKQGVHPKIVQERLGHATITMTLDIYSHVTPGLQKAAAENFDRLLNTERENEPVPNHY
jgi:integrase